MEKVTIEVKEPGQEGVYHIPGVHNMQNTLCGWVDVTDTEFDFKDHPCNCLECITALKKIKGLRFPKGYFSKYFSRI